MADTISPTTVNVGSAPNDGTGDNLRESFVKINSNFANLSSSGITIGNLITTGYANVTSNLIASGSYVPATASASGVAGTIIWDANYVYVCVATGTWKRASISTW